jgi:TRAP-type mannitol/chloroaromatic compound transport system permease small subunit
MSIKEIDENEHTDVMSTVSSSLNDTDALLRREAALQWGWGLFTSCAMGCALTSYWLYSLVTDDGAGTVRFWLESFFCVPFCLLSCAGFVQLIGRTTCNHLAAAWPSLTSWRRVLIVLSVIGTILFLVSFTIFLASLTAPTVDWD